MEALPKSDWPPEAINRYCPPGPKGSGAGFSGEDSHLWEQKTFLWQHRLLDFAMWNLVRPGANPKVMDFSTLEAHSRSLRVLLAQ